MAYELPELGVYFEQRADPCLPENGKSVFYGRLDKFNTMPWMVKVFQSNNYSIYRINLPAQIGYQREARQRGLRGKLWCPRDQHSRCPA